MEKLITHALATTSHNIIVDHKGLLIHEQRCSWEKNFLALNTKQQIDIV